MSRDPITINGKEWIYDARTRTHRPAEAVDKKNHIAGKGFKDIPSQSTIGAMKRKTLSGIDVDLLYAEYLSCGSVHRAGAAVGISGDSVCKLFKKNGLKTNRGKWSADEDEAIVTMYQDESIVLEDIAKALGRSLNAVDCRAGRLGVRGARKFFVPPESSREKMRDSQKANVTPESSLDKSRRMIEHHKNNPHPRGMAGKKHTDETKALIAKKGIGRVNSPESIEKQLRTTVERHGKLGNTMSRMNSSWKAGWREIAGRRIYFRSRWEFNYGLYLQFLLSQGKIKKWDHEPETFWFEKIRRGCRSYLPDFRVEMNDGQIEYHEVKGWMDDRSKTKIKRMKKYHPTVVLIIIDAKWFKANSGTLSALIPEWESMAKKRNQRSPVPPSQSQKHVGRKDGNCDY